MIDGLQPNDLLDVDEIVLVGQHAFVILAAVPQGCGRSLVLDPDFRHPIEWWQLSLDG
ncbi:hypothetical protein LP414_23375 [Polaromonas sp. P1(28)-13]|nr:hypothetical protein LP414_23375 [Polaromonas sp. P1(28)-13]